MKEKEPQHIEILEWAKKHSDVGFNLKTLKEELKLSSKEFQMLLSGIVHNNLFCMITKKDNYNPHFDGSAVKNIPAKETWDSNTSDKTIYLSDDVKYCLAFNGHSMLQEYYDLRESRNNAKQAQINAEIAQKDSSNAIGISIATLIISIIFSVASIGYTIYYGETIQDVKVINSNNNINDLTNQLKIEQDNLNYQLEIEKNKTKNLEEQIDISLKEMVKYGERIKILENE